MVPYRPCVAALFIPRGLLLLRDVLGFDKESGKVPHTLLACAKLCLIISIIYTVQPVCSYCLSMVKLSFSALVPGADGKKRKGKKAELPWNDMDASKGKLSTWIEPERLPTINEFRFSHPS